MSKDLLAILIFAIVLFIITCITSIYEVRSYRKNHSDIERTIIPSKDKSVQQDR